MLICIDFGLYYGNKMEEELSACAYIHVPMLTVCYRILHFVFEVYDRNLHVNDRKKTLRVESRAKTI